MELQFQGIFDTKTYPRGVLCDKLTFKVQDTHYIVDLEGLNTCKVTEENGCFHVIGCASSVIAQSSSYAIQDNQEVPLTQLTESRLAHALLVASCADLVLLDEEENKATQVSAHLTFAEMQVELNNGNILLYDIKDDAFSKEDTRGCSPTILAVYHATPLLHYSIEETESGNYEIRAWNNAELSGYYMYHKSLTEVPRTAEEIRTVFEEMHHWKTENIIMLEHEIEMELN